MATLIQEINLIAFWQLEDQEDVRSVPRGVFDIEVIILAFNSELNIVDALKSMVAQDFEGKLGVLIHDDASTDRTIDFLIDFLKDSQIHVTLIQQVTNQYSQSGRFYRELITGSQSTYVAMLDADDIWLSKNKLSKQFSFMESNSAVNLTYHDFLAENRSSSKGLLQPHFTARFSEQALWQLALENFIGTLTVMVRTSCLRELSLSGYDNLPAGDFPLWALAASKGKFRYVPGLVSFYRSNVSGISQNQTRRQKLRDFKKISMFVRKNLTGHARLFWSISSLTALRLFARGFFRATSRTRNTKDLIESFKE
jgi:glycosyltransferase involved in cell wall biosynthesis